MSEHDGDELLAEVALGLRSEGEPAVQALLGEAEARERLARLRATLADLDAAGSGAREVLEAAAGLQSASGDERVEAVLRTLARQASAGASRSEHSLGRRPWLIGVAAAAAVVLLFLGLERWGFGGPDARGTPSPQPRLLGSGSIELTAPGASFGADVVFQWQGELGTGERFRVRVFDAANPLAFEPLMTSPTTTQTRWTPSDPTSLPDEIRWSVERLGPDGSPRASAEAYSRRSSH